MKHLSFIVFILLVHSLSGQQQVVLEIDHFLKEKIFQFDSVTQNNLDHPLTIRRMDYYLSGVQITHDGGKLISFPELYILVSLDENQEKTLIDLGNHDVENIDKITFYLGLDSLINHSDPALWPVGHPLGPRFPSMHWGWASGYRFIAMEGKGGPANNQEIQLHALGNQYHKPITIDVKPISENNILKIKLSADYTQLFYDISLKQGIFVHGSDKQIVYLADNFVKRLFSASATSNVQETQSGTKISVFPNPAENAVSIRYSSFLTGSNKLFATLTDDSGKIIVQRWIQNMESMEINASGIYFLHFRNEQGNVFPSQKIVVP